MISRNFILEPTYELNRTAGFYKFSLSPRERVQKELKYELFVSERTQNNFIAN